MKKFNHILIALIALSVSSCYESYEKDFDVTRAYFASQRPLRTLVADTGMSIKVGVAIGGKREVDPSDWATFEIDPSLLEGTSLTLMPEEYYTLADPYRMSVSNTNLAICDVRVNFSDEFYNDVNALGTYYAIPFRLTGHSQEEVATDVNGNPKDYSIVAVKFVSRWHGTYYVKGQMTNLSTNEVTVYSNKDLSRNITRDIISLSRDKIQRPGFGNTTETGEAVNLTVNDAGIEEVRVQRANAERELQRYKKLLEEDAVTRQQYDNVKTAYDAINARYEQALRMKHSTSLTKDEQTHRLGQNEAAVRLAQAAVDLARLNLSYTVIIATCDGVTGRKDIHEGQLVQPGQTMVDIVDNGDLWVIANYRETQLPNIKEGAEVTFTADAVPGITYKGVVESISDATGAAFSLIPQDNATGNFVKVEQRVPVRIRLQGNDADKVSRLRAGFNVECKVKY